VELPNPRSPRPRLMKTLVDFLGVTLTAEEHAKVSERCTFKYMKDL